ncbi:MAG: hypothetical protein MUD17_04025 [Gemmatimonadaceae bacterium]|nr:hypothetical protein [Gemmatimonadaceae bacterium]
MNLKALAIIVMASIALTLEPKESAASESSMLCGYACTSFSSCDDPSLDQAAICTTLGCADHRPGCWFDTPACENKAQVFCHVPA